MKINDGNIEAFWQWFVKNEQTIQACIENNDVKQREFVVDQLNEWILGLGVFTWDVGLDDDDRWFLMISPNGNPEMMTLGNAIMEQAPEHINWLFYAGKPAKNWNRQFCVYDDYMDEHFIDASQWHFLVFTDDDEMLELVIEAKNIPHLDPETAETAAEQFVIQEIGERARILRVSSIDIVSELDSEDEDSKKSVLELKKELE